MSTAENCDNKHPFLQFFQIRVWDSAELWMPLLTWKRGNHLNGFVDISQNFKELKLDSQVIKVLTMLWCSWWRKKFAKCTKNPLQTKNMGKRRKFDSRHTVLQNCQVGILSVIPIQESSKENRAYKDPFLWTLIDDGGLAKTDRDFW